MGQKTSSNDSDTESNPSGISLHLLQRLHCIQVLLGSVKRRLYLVFHLSIRSMPYQNRAASLPPLAEQKRAQKNQMVPSERRAESQSRAQATPTKLPQVQCKWFSWSNCTNSVRQTREFAQLLLNEHMNRL